MVQKSTDILLNNINSLLKVGVRQHAMSEGKCAGMQDILGCLCTHTYVVPKAIKWSNLSHLTIEQSSSYFPFRIHNNSIHFLKPSDLII